MPVLSAQVMSTGSNEIFIKMEKKVDLFLFFSCKLADGGGGSELREDIP